RRSERKYLIIRAVARTTASRPAAICRALQKTLLLQKLREHLQAHFAVVDFEHALFDRQRQGQQLCKAIAHPCSVIERRLGGEILTPNTLDQQFQQRCQRPVAFGQRYRRLGWDRCHFSNHETIVGDAVRLHLEARAALGLQVKYAELRDVASGDAGERPDRGEVGRLRRRSRTSYFVAVLEQTHPERLLVLETHLGHLDVALLEDLKWQHSPGKEDGLQRKQRERRQ